MTSSTSVDINLGRREMVILGTQYAGEMKKGLFGVMHYLMPKRRILSLHSGCNMGRDGDVALFFGLSGAFVNRTEQTHHPWMDPAARTLRCRYLPNRMHLTDAFALLISLSIPYSSSFVIV